MLAVLVMASASTWALRRLIDAPDASELKGGDLTLQSKASATPLRCSLRRVPQRLKQCLINLWNERREITCDTMYHIKNKHCVSLLNQESMTVYHHFVGYLAFHISVDKRSLPSNDRFLSF
jgi:hypothetical protein